MALPTLPTLPAAATAVRSLPPGAQALAVASRVQQYQGLVVAVAGDEQQAYRLEAELRFFLGKDWPVVHLQDTETLPFDPYSPHQEILSERLAALHRLPDTPRGALIVTADALLQRLPPVAWLQGRSFFLKTGQKLNPHTLRERLVSAGYQSVSQVQSQGEFALRGSLLDLFPMGSASAYRLDWFDDEIEAIRSFDPETQRSQDKVAEVRLLPAREFPTDKDGIETFRRNYREYFPGDLSRSRVYAEVSKNLMPGGIEAYLPLFFANRETATLADYLPGNALWLVLDDLDARLEADWKQIVERRERYDGNLDAYVGRVLAGLSKNAAAPAPATTRGTINGMETATVRMRGQDGSGRVVDVTVAAYAFAPGTAYSFVVLQPQGAGLGDLAPLVQSFSRMTPAEIAAVRPRIVDVVTVQRGDSVASLSARMAYADLKTDRFRVLNGLSPDATTLTPGRKVKLIVWGTPTRL